MKKPENCQDLVEMDVLRRRANALNVEVGKPMLRCRQKTPKHWGQADPRAVRWLHSGGSPLVLGPCSNKCPMAIPDTDDNMTEYGLFNDEGCVEQGFYSLATAEKALAERYSPDDDLSISPMCEDHEGQPSVGCEDCEGEEDD